MKVKIVTEPFVPTPDEEFYYKPSEKWNYLVWCDKKYVGYFIRVYGEIPPRINPVKLHLMDDYEQVIVSDFKISLSEDTLEGILNKWSFIKYLFHKGLRISEYDVIFCIHDVI